jgi:hypothetical protein
MSGIGRTCNWLGFNNQGDCPPRASRRALEAARRSVPEPAHVVGTHGLDAQRDVAELLILSEGRRRAGRSDVGRVTFWAFPAS